MKQTNIDGFIVKMFPHDPLWDTVSRSDYVVISDENDINFASTLAYVREHGNIIDFDLHTMMVPKATIAKIEQWVADNTSEEV